LLVIQSSLGFLVGIVRIWPTAEFSARRRDVGYLGQSGLDLIAASLSADDPDLAVSRPPSENFLGRPRNAA
jgi:hypothetical protein